MKQNIAGQVRIDPQSKKFSLTKQNSRPRMELRKPFRKKILSKNQKTAKARAKMPRVNKNH